METIKLTVNGMSCGHCVSSIEGALGSLERVESVHVSLEGNEVDVAYDPSKADVAQMKETIEDLGYDIA
ncbi:copper chaperone CopZ [Halobacillus sp. A5]|uniref:copper chaperone CopZ n=1 Tax=Halobacillus sp. A5 TaxID=2880263 RepID=UPI0020A6C9E5|nr:copper chaperone CopZ [Halobacillus sp. A5]MCP3027777.1 copper chaperone CopZ [Halobacillus sp. A5]